MKKFVFSVASRATGSLQIKPSRSGDENVCKVGRKYLLQNGAWISKSHANSVAFALYSIITLFSPQNMLFVYGVCMTKVTRSRRERSLLALVLRRYFKMWTTAEKIVLDNVREGTLERRCAIAPKEHEKINAREVRGGTPLSTSLPSPPLLFIAFFTSHRSPLSERLGQATIWTLATGYHELHVRGMQIYKTLIMHVQIEQDFPY